MSPQPDDERWCRLLDAMVSDILRNEDAWSPEVERAMRTVPRHTFLPGVPPEVAYRNEALLLKRDEAGMPLSSSSQPSLVGQMLHALGVRPGDHVLEVGTGSGYNAALLAELVGPTGQVTTLDIDPGVCARAAACLRSAGYDRVEVRHGDAYRVAEPRGSMDRIIVTAGCDRIPALWAESRREGGWLELPLFVGTRQFVLTFVKRGADLELVALCRGQFMSMRGASAARGATGVRRVDRWMVILPGPTDADATDDVLSRADRLADVELALSGVEWFSLALLLAVRETRSAWMLRFDGEDPVAAAQGPALIDPGRADLAAVLEDGWGSRRMLGGPSSPVGAALIDAVAEVRRNAAGGQRVPPVRAERAPVRGALRTTGDFSLRVV